MVCQSHIPNPENVSTEEHSGELMLDGLPRLCYMRGVDNPEAHHSYTVTDRAARIMRKWSFVIHRADNWLRRSIMKKTSGRFAYCLIFFLSACLFPHLPSFADDKAVLTDGQTIYVPAYSHIYIGNRERPFLLTVTLSIRNIDPKHPIIITGVDYYETQGKRLKRYLKEPIILKPMESIRYVVPENDTSGGSGANFIVEWKSDKPVNAPIVESVMISTRTQQGVSFTSRGRAIITSH